MREVVATTESPALLDEDPAVLSRIVDPAVHLAIWRRPRSSWIDTLEWDSIDDIDTIVAGPDFRTVIQGLMGDAGYSDSPQEQTLAADIAAQATRFAQILQSADLRFRLEIVETDACRKFHMDMVRARLLATYAGEGTQWIEAAAGPDGPVHQLGVGDVALFKGRLWTDEPAILHRSPPIVGTGIKRLLLALDPA